jgi:hypothetical protein
MSFLKDKSLKGVAEAVMKVIEAEQKAKQDYDHDGKVESPKAEYLGSRIRAAKLAGKLKEETQPEMLSESDKWIAGAIKKPGALHRKLGVPEGEKIPAAKVAAAAKKGGELGKEARLAQTLKKLPRHHGPRNEEVEQLQEYESKNGVFKHKAKLAMGAKYGESDYSKGGEEDTESKKDLDYQKKSKTTGARQNNFNRGKSTGYTYKPKSKAMKEDTEEKLSFTEMLQLYNEAGVEVIAKIVPETVKFGDQEVEVIDADKINGAIETTVVEGASNDQFNAQLKTAEWKSATKDDDTVRPIKKKADVAGAASLGVKIQKEEAELEERAKWRTSSIAHDTGYRKDGYHGGIENTADTGKEDLLRGRSMNSRYGSPKKSDIKVLKKSITKNLSQMKKEEAELEEARGKEIILDKPAKHGEFQNRGKQTGGGLRKLQTAITKRMTDDKPKKTNEEVEQIDEISKETAGKYLTAPQGKGANKYKVSADKASYPDIGTMNKHATNVRRALQRSDSSSIYKKPSYYKEEEQLDETLPASATAGDYIDDFVHSKNPKFEGKSKEERKKMALGAFYAKNKGK